MSEQHRTQFLRDIRLYAVSQGIEVDYMYHTGDEVTRLYFKKGSKRTASYIKWYQILDSGKSTFDKICSGLDEFFNKEKNMATNRFEDGRAKSIKDVIDEMIKDGDLRLKGDITSGYRYYNYCYNPPKTSMFDIERVIFNEPATIVLWKDGTKTVVKADGDDFDPEKGLAMAIAKKALGNQGNYFNTIRKWRDTYNPKKPEIEFTGTDILFDGKKMSELISEAFDKKVDTLDQRLKNTFLKDSDV